MRPPRALRDDEKAQVSRFFPRKGGAMPGGHPVPESLAATWPEGRPASRVIYRCALCRQYAGANDSGFCRACDGPWEPFSFEPPERGPLK